MAISFTKMHGLGNDFVVLDMRAEKYDLSAAQIAAMGDRRHGIGFDQLLVISPTKSEESDIYYTIYNRDGSESGQCGNGVRCVAQYVLDHGGLKGNSLKVESKTATMEVYPEDDFIWRVNMGTPKFNPKAVPINSKDKGPLHIIEANGQHIEVFAVSIGNPHAVINNDQFNLELEEFGPILEQHSIFPEAANIGFLNVTSKEHINLRVYERGTGETLACGSGACAAAVAAIYQGWCNENINISLPGGQLHLSWEKGDNPVWMTGPATYVFNGHYEFNK